MNHLEAQTRLVDLSEGTLKRSLRRETEAHVSECGECQDWLATRKLLNSECLMRPTHPSSEQIALVALEPSSLSPEARGKLENHLDECKACRQEQKLTREALEKAKQPMDSDWSTSNQSAIRGAFQRNPVLVRVAALLAVLVGTGLLIRWEQLTEYETRISNLQIEGTKTIEVEGRLLASNVEVDRDSRLVLRAGDTVMLGEGFSVGNGASLVIETSSSTDSKKAQSEGHTQ